MPSEKTGFAHVKLLIGAGVFVLLVVILVATGTLSGSVSITRNSDVLKPPSLVTEESGGFPESNEEEVVRSELSSQPSKFSGSLGTPQFEIYLPKGWAETNVSDQLVFAAGSVISDRSASGGGFNANLNVFIGPHDLPAASIYDYDPVYKDYLLQSYPSMEFVDSHYTSVDGMDVWVLEFTQNQNGVDIYQVQYLFYVDSDNAMAVTATSLASAWPLHEEVIGKSLNSIKRLDTPAKAQNTVKEPVASGDLELYTHDLYTISYPRGWILSGDTANAVFNPETSLVPGIQPMEFSVSVEDLSGSPQTLDQYVAASKNQIETELPSAILTQSTSATLDGNPAQSLYFEAKLPNFIFMWNIIISIKGNTGYIISYYGHQTDVEANQVLLNEAISTFKFL